MAKDSNYYENERKTRPKKYRGYDGGIYGYLIDERSNKIEIIINRFLKIDKMSYSFYSTDKDGPFDCGFNYYYSVTETDGRIRKIYGQVIWKED